MWSKNFGQILVVFGFCIYCLAVSKTVCSVLKLSCWGSCLFSAVRTWIPKTCRNTIPWNPTRASNKSLAGSPVMALTTPTLRIEGPQFISCHLQWEEDLVRDLCLGVLVALLLSTLEVCGAPLPKVDKDTKLRLVISCYKWTRAQRHRKKRHKGKTSKRHKYHTGFSMHCLDNSLLITTHLWAPRSTSTSME